MRKFFIFVLAVITVTANAQVTEMAYQKYSTYNGATTDTLTTVESYVAGVAFGVPVNAATMTILNGAANTDTVAKIVCTTDLKPFYIHLGVRLPSGIKIITTGNGIYATLIYR
jgi:hypothetical protein